MKTDIFLILDIVSAFAEVATGEPVSMKNGTIVLTAESGYVFDKGDQLRSQIKMGNWRPTGSTGV